ncbi:hypothetical protein [Devosia aquimaris]|uniref:hypothetical protein n=1 Tax=Devosia aquimaris TaxID=2866214 RepID=UPI001CD12DB4|nr:hypothetical protein [Devosia sp. CJK-A8-3]
MKLLRTQIAEILSYVGSIASIVALLNPSIFQNDQAKYILSNPFSQALLVIILLVSAIVTATNIIFSGYDRKIIRAGKNRDKKINDEMKKILNGRENVTVLSRNLSWAAQGSELYSILEKKAASGDLNLFIHSANPASVELQKRGATVTYYGGYGFVPESRFTVVSHRSATQKMAIGYADGDDHIITWYRHGAGPELHLAKDLLELLEKSCGAVAKNQ